jgi:hypothetical protein
VIAVDINEAMLEHRARARDGRGKVTFRGRCAGPAGRHGAARRGARESRVHRLLWSHLNAKEQDLLLATLRKRLGKDVLLVMLDDIYVEGVSEADRAHRYAGHDLRRS